MLKKLLPPLLTLMAGGAGYALRRWQLTSGFEPDTGLAIPGAPSAWALMGFSLLLFLLFFLLSRRGQKTLTWDAAFAAGKQNTLAVTALLLAAMLLLASAGMEIITRSVNGLYTYEGETLFARTTSMVLFYLRMVLCVGSLPCVFLWARAILRGEGGQECLGTLEPCLLYCVWLISTYQARAADPVVQDYLYEVLAIVTTLLGLYFVAGHSFGNGKPRQAILFCLAGTYFSLVTLADNHLLADTFRHLFAALYLITHAAMLLAAPADETQLTTPNREVQDHG